ncbi:MAG: hypothetical protein GY772_28905 [bacterium]|nr:hypothetical protein [bacterium]
MSKRRLRNRRGHYTNKRARRAWTPLQRQAAEDLQTNALKLLGMLGKYSADGSVTPEEGEQLVGQAADTVRCGEPFARTFAGRMVVNGVASALDQAAEAIGDIEAADFDSEAQVVEDEA